MIKILKDFVSSIWSIINILKGNKLSLYNNINKLKDSTDSTTLRILGNGETLNNALTLFDESTDVEYMVVNRHVLTENFSTLKPKYYVIADPFFFEKTEGLNILKMISEKVNWKMYFLTPFSKKNKIVLENIFNENEQINICFLNSIPFQGFDNLKCFLYKHNLSMPRPQNVMVPGIYCGICTKFQRVELYGVEHSWPRYLSVNEFNEVELEDRHFYNTENVKKQTWNSTHDKDTKLHEILRAFAYMFEAYWELQKFSSQENVKIINYTKGSFIDAFRKE